MKNNLFLNELNNIIGDFYIVGGCVRDFLLGTPATDIDICGTLSLSKLENILEAHNNIKMTILSETLGTCKLESKIKNKIYVVEYACMRKELYNEFGVHSPTSVEFTKNLLVDAYRRDFTINAIYYDYKNQVFLDPVLGIKDINSKIIKSVKSTPYNTMKYDAIRIFRMIRFSCKLGFKIENKTYKAAKKSVKHIKNLPVERIKAEIDSIIMLDNCYNAIKLMDDLNIFKVDFINDYNFKNLKADYYVRMTAFLILLFGENIDKAKAFMNHYLYPKKDCKMLLDSLYLYNNTTTKTSLFDLSSHDATSLYTAVYLLERKNKDFNLIYEKIESLKDYPKDINDIEITGDEIFNIFNLSGKDIKTAKEKAFKAILQKKITNTKKDIIEFLSKNI